MENYIGLDAHSKTCTFVVVNELGQEVAAKQVQTSEGNLVGFVRSLRGKKVLTFEESNLSKWLYGVFGPEVDRQIVCNPSYLVRRKGPKGDYLDGLHLAQQLRGNFLTPVFHEESFLFELRSLVSAYQALVLDISRLKCRYKAVFRSQALSTKGTKIYRQENHQKELKGEMYGFIAQDYFSRLALLEKAKLQYTKCFQKYAKEIAEIKALSTIPGMGPVRSCMIAALVGSPQRFENKHRFWSYCELVRHDFVSDGKSYGKKTIRANRCLKNVFMGAAQKGIDTNKEIQKYFDFMVAKGLGPKAVRKNIARIMASISLAVMRTKKPYNPKIWRRKYKSEEELNVT